MGSKDRSDRIIPVYKLHENELRAELTSIL
jgi:hypothetical protein